MDSSRGGDPRGHTKRLEIGFQPEEIGASPSGEGADALWVAAGSFPRLATVSNFACRSETSAIVAAESAHGTIGDVQKSSVP